MESGPFVKKGKTILNDFIKMSMRGSLNDVTLPEETDSDIDSNKNDHNKKPIAKIKGVLGS
jgi:hypothetical protein